MNDKIADFKDTEVIHLDSYFDMGDSDIVGKSKDNVNHPSHYEQSCSLECIDAMELIFGYRYVYCFCVCNAWKYIWRYKNKNGEEDLKKARWYIDRCLWYDRNCDWQELWEETTMVERLDHWLLGHNIT